MSSQHSSLIATPPPGSLERIPLVYTDYYAVPFYTSIAKVTTVLLLGRVTI